MRNVITAIVYIQRIFHAISAAVEGIGKAVHAIFDALAAPLPSVEELMGMVTQRGLEFEKDSGWSPAVGAARIGLPP